MRARGVLSRRRMNPIFFGLKRAFHGTLRIGRRSLEALGLTAARFDLLYALTDEGRALEAGTRQSALRRMLGVSRPAVSRMLRSLEDLGFVRRERSKVDRRQIDVYLTILGSLRVRRAFRKFVRSGWSQVAPECALGWAAPTERELFRWENCMSQTETLEPLLDDIRIALRDFATLEYRWYPLEE